MCRSHPAAAMLAGYAVGRASPGVALATAAHLAFCPRCRAEVARYEALAGALVATAETAAEAPGLEVLLARLDSPDGTPIAMSRFPGPLPAAVAEAVGLPFDSIPWRLCFPGVEEHRLSAGGRDSAALLRLRAGAAIPTQAPDSSEIAVILDGALIDGRRRYGPGDLAFAGPARARGPRACEGGPCLCLAVVSGGAGLPMRPGRAQDLSI